ncbi:unnamed protein product [Rhizoctonia solani]|uniref:Asl1-like glycosyl hydrolase catalytic domain-containing protein n=1 Tax=Rhizoctonia solani TaxID=456999 RepID=A0A8H3AY64_9AGAM|nr:unnamed protein product [Rhizoctonia solani]
MSMEESISLEETNKIRISLGLKPLTDDKAPSNDKDQEAEQNYAKRKKAEEEDRKKGEIAKNIAKARNRIELNRRLVGATLGDTEEDVGLDAKNWIKKAKRKEKELAAKRQAEQESMDKMAQATYDERDLEGLKVSHDMDKLNEGEDRILTLKDSRILDNEEDELQNIDMAEEEEDKKRHELKTKRRDYTGYDDDEFTPGQAGMKRTVLSKYDEDIDGVKQGSFRLGAAAQTGPKMTIQDDDTMTVNRALLSLEYTKNVEISDYMKEGDVGFKKPKTKKKRASRRNQPEETEPAAETTTMEIDEKPAPTFTRRERNLDVNFVDDDELQAALARSRRSKARKVNKLTPEEIAQRVAEEKNEAEAEEAMRNEEPAAGGLELDDTSEFVRSVTFDPVAVEPKKLALQLPTAQPEPAAAAAEQAIESMDVDDEKEDGEADEEDDEAMLNAIEGMITAAAGGTMPDEASTSAKVEEELDIGTAAAAITGRGMAGTLKALKQQGILAGPDAEVEERERLQRQKDTWLASHRRLLAERELARLRSRGMTKDQAAREYENRVREQQEARDTMDSFKDYKPDVELKYYDDTGRELDTKEAWKALSHRFHGKGSGRAKMEKRMKKIAEEKKRQAMIAGDTPLSMNKAFQTRQEKAGQAHMVLSVGNRGAVPQLAEFLDNRDISKSNKQADKGKKKKAEGEATPVMSSVDITSFVAPTTTATTSTSQASTPPPPKMKPAFSRVTAEPVSGSASPAGGVGLERGKVAFGFSVKRKAENEVFLAIRAVAVAPRTGGSKAGLGWGGGGEIAQFEVGKVSWYYTWSPTSWVQPPPNLEYVPMLWGGKDVSAFTKAVTPASIASKGWTHILGMNEPQEPSQANMSPADAANTWKKYLEPLRVGNPNLRLGSPAPSSHPNGIQWIFDFLGNCNGGCTVDFIALHYYGVNATDFIRHQRVPQCISAADMGYGMGLPEFSADMGYGMGLPEFSLDTLDLRKPPAMLSAHVPYLYSTLWLVFLCMSPDVEGRTLSSLRRQAASTPLKAGLGWGGGGNISQFEGHEVS